MNLAPLVVVTTETARAGTFGWEIAGAIGTIGATVVALCLGLYQWFKDISRQRDVRAALSRALQTDLATWRTVVNQSRDDFDNKKLTHEDHYVDWVMGLSNPTMPTFERFAGMLPDLGRPLSTKVVHAYAESIRVAEVVTRQTSKTGIRPRDFVDISSKVRPRLDVMSEHLGDAIAALEPYASAKAN